MLLLLLVLLQLPSRQLVLLHTCCRREAQWLLVHAGCPTIVPCCEELKRATIEGRTVVAATYLLYSDANTNTGAQIQTRRQNLRQKYYTRLKCFLWGSNCQTALYLVTSSVGWSRFSLMPVPQKTMALTKMRVVMAVCTLLVFCLFFSQPGDVSFVQ